MSDFVRPLPGPMHPGSVITIDGFIPPDAHQFSINLSCTPNYLGGDMALHVDHRFFNGNVVRNSHEQGHWRAEEIGGAAFPLHKNSNFQCTITSFPDKYQIAYNGQFFADFRHRIPQDRVNHVIVRGTAQIFNVSFGGYGMPQMGASSYGGPPGYGQPQPAYGQPAYGQPGFDQYGYGQPGFGGQPSFSQPPGPGGVRPQKRNIPGGLYPGRMIYISGTPNPGAKTFTINLKPQEFGGDIHFHLSIRFQNSVVVRNANFNGSWGQEDTQHPQFPFHPGQPFNLIILTEQGGYKVAVDNKHFVDFAHRNPNIQALQWVELEGDVSGVTINMT